MLDAAEILLKSGEKGVVPITVVAATDWAKVKAGMAKPLQNWAAAQGFEAAPLTVLMAANDKGELSSIYVGAPRAGDDPFALGAISSRLPAGRYGFATAPAQPELVALGWCLELYKYDPFRSTKVKQVKLVCPKGVAHDAVVAVANTSFHVRDHVNAPANVFGPDELEKAARHVAGAFGVKVP
jgi:leucyl aminopeptidase